MRDIIASLFHEGVERNKHFCEAKKSRIQKEYCGRHLRGSFSLIHPDVVAKSIIPFERIGQKILLIRGQKAMLDSDLAKLYGVTVKSLNQAVSRNKGRFPKDFVFQLTNSERKEFLRSQIVTSKETRGGRRYLPYAFTEQGVAMLSSVLRSSRAIEVNIMIMRAFVQLRQWLASHEDLARKLAEMEQKYDAQFKTIFEALTALMTPEVPDQKETIGFKLG